MQIKIYLLSLLTVICIAVGQVLFRYGAKGQNINNVMSVIKIAFSPVVLFALLLYLGSTLLWLYILSKASLSSVYPIQALAFPIVLILSMLFFKDTIPVHRWVGIVVIFIGLVISTR